MLKTRGEVTTAHQKACEMAESAPPPGQHSPCMASRRLQSHTSSAALHTPKAQIIAPFCSVVQRTGIAVLLTVFGEEAASLHGRLHACRAEESQQGSRERRKERQGRPPSAEPGCKATVKCSVLRAHWRPGGPGCPQGRGGPRGRGRASWGAACRRRGRPCAWRRRRASCGAGAWGRRPRARPWRPPGPGPALSRGSPAPLPHLPAPASRYTHHLPPPCASSLSPSPLCLSVCACEPFRTCFTTC